MKKTDNKKIGPKGSSKRMVSPLQGPSNTPISAF